MVELEQLLASLRSQNELFRLEGIDVRDQLLIKTEAICQLEARVVDLQNLIAIRPAEDLEKPKSDLELEKKLETLRNKLESTEHYYENQLLIKDNVPLSHLDN